MEIEVYLVLCELYPVGPKMNISLRRQKAMPNVRIAELKPSQAPDSLLSHSRKLTTPYSMFSQSLHTKAVFTSTSSLTNSSQSFAQSCIPFPHRNVVPGIPPSALNPSKAS